MVISKIIESDDFITRIIEGKGENKILLVNPFASDFRLPWAKWHQPTGLLQLASFLRKHDFDIRLVDFLNSENERIIRRKLRTVERNEYSIPFWRFGPTSDSDIRNRIKKQLRGAWKPDAVFFTSLNSIWWEDVRDVIAVTRKLLPDTAFYLGGHYPMHEPDHAKNFSGADFIVISTISEISQYPSDISLYQSPPKSAGIYFYYSRDGDQLPRPSNAILDEITAKIELGVSEFAFFDDEIKPKDKSAFIDLLDLVIQKKIRSRFALLGNISASSMDKRLAIKMKRAGVRKIFLKCNLNLNEMDYFADSLEDYRSCMQHLDKDANYNLGGNDIAAMLVIGVPFENLKTVAKRAINLAHIARSVIPVPFQYVPSIHENYGFRSDSPSSGNRLIEEHIRKHLNSPEKLNGKIYPFAELSGYNFEEYMELTRLTTMLNSKYRGTTFDFLGDSFTAKTFRETIRTKGWDPFKNRSNAEAVVVDELFMKSENK